jgi:hypothetical protein
MIFHKKFSAVPASSDPDDIDGPAWNDVHVYGAGSILPVAHIIAQATDDPDETIAIDVLGAQPITATSHWAGHHFSVSFDVIDIPVPAGCSLDFFLAGENYRLYTPAFYRVLSSVSVTTGGPAVVVSFNDTDGAPFKMQDYAKYSVTLCAVVVADELPAPPA